MRLHPREQPVTEARIDLMQRYLDWQRAHDLTDAEHLSVVAGVFGDSIGNIAKYQIRQERHGDTDTPGGWE